MRIDNMRLDEAKEILKKNGYRVEPPKYWVVTFGSEDEANEEEHNFANEGGWDSVVNVEKVGNKLYIEYNKNIVDVIDEWFGDKAKVVTGTELADVGDLGYIGECARTIMDEIR
jgi:acyl carrier protein